jgi:hypothetical protein
MNERYCDKEQEVAAALAGGAPDSAILDHARECAVCSEILLLQEFLREGAQLASHEIEDLPDATVVWRKAQAIAREQALARATLPIRVVRTVACAAGVLAVPLLLVESQRLWPGLTNAWRAHLSSATRLWPSASNEPALLLAITGAILSIALSSWYILRDA